MQIDVTTFGTMNFQHSRFPQVRLRMKFLARGLNGVYTVHFSAPPPFILQFISLSWRPFLSEERVGANR